MTRCRVFFSMVKIIFCDNSRLPLWLLVSAGLFAGLLVGAGQGRTMAEGMVVGICAYLAAVFLLWLFFVLNPIPLEVFAA